MHLHAEQNVVLVAGESPQGVGVQRDLEGDGGKIHREVPGVGADWDGAVEGRPSIGAEVIILALVVVTEDLDLSVDVVPRVDLLLNGGGKGELGGSSTLEVGQWGDDGVLQGPTAEGEGGGVGEGDGRQQSNKEQSLHGSTLGLIRNGT